MHYLKQLSCWLFFCLLYAKTYSQDIIFRHLTTESGLSNNSVLAIAQDSTGFMWFGTVTGLSRYDGSRFRNYTFKSSEPDAPIVLDYTLSLLCDSKNNLWAGTSKNLKRYNFQKDSFENIVITGQKQPVTVYTIYEDKKHNLWIGTSIGLYKRENNGAIFLQQPGIAGKNIRCIFEDSRNFIWVGTTEGLSRLTPSANGDNISNFVTNAADPHSISSNSISAVTEDNLHKIWIGTQGNGINIFDPDTKSFSRITSKENLAHNTIRNITALRNGQLWVGTQDGLSVIDPGTKKIQSYQNNVGNRNSLSKNSIYNICEDNRGNIWVGTYYGGINYSYANNTSFENIQSRTTGSINNDIISSIAEDAQHDLWIGTEGGGVNFLNRKTGSAIIFKNDPQDNSTLASNLIRTIYIDKEQNIWCGTHGGGLNVLPKDEKRFKRYLFKENDPATLRSEIFSILEDDNNKLWIGSNTGLKVFSKEGTNLSPIDITALPGYVPGMQPRSLLKDQEGKIWIGGEQGLYVFANNNFKLVNKKINVTSLHIDAAGNIWTCLDYQGLAKYNQQGGELMLYNDKNGFPARSTYALLQDDSGYYWISTDNGLIKFDAAKNIAQVYTISDGLAGNQFNVKSFLKANNGEFFFGGFNGLTHFFPDKIATNKTVAPIVFTGLKLFNDEVTIDAEDGILKNNINSLATITLKHDQNVVTIEFALLNFIKSNKNKFAYKLQGFDKDWNYTTNPFATYTNLSPGHYTLLVKGANNDGLWSDPVALSMSILPPIWQTWWAYTIYLIAIVALLFLLLRYFFLQALLKKDEALHQAKLNFFTNISHEIKTHLSLIVTPVEKLIDSNRENAFMLQQLNSVKNYSSRLLKLVNELMDFRKAETNHLLLHFEEQNFIAFLQQIYESFREASLEKNITISFSHNIDNIPLHFDTVQMEKVFFNLLTNAFKFTPEGGEINLVAEQQKDKIIVKVEDNGRGIAPEHIDKIFDNFFQVPDYNKQNTGYGIGLALSKDIVELHDGSITAESINSDNERKTIFSVILSQEKLSKKINPGTSIARSENIITPRVEKENVPEPANEPSLNNDKSATILIVEDNPEIRSLINQVFNRDYNVIEATNGLQGLDTAVTQIPDIIISDVMMPEMDGFTLCNKLKTDERTSHIPVLLLTAKSAQNDQIEGLETGADIYLTKPFSPKILELSIRNLLSAREKLWLKFTEKTTAPEKKEDLSFYKNSIDKEFIIRLTQIVEEYIDDPEFGVEKLSRKIAMSTPVLYRKLKATTGLTVNEFIKNQRLQKAAELLMHADTSVSEAAFAVAFYDTKYFSREFTKKFGKKPSEYGKEEKK